MTRVGCGGARHVAACRADARLARDVQVARVAVAASGAVGDRRVRALPRARIARAGDVTLVARGAPDLAVHLAHAVETAGHIAGVAVAARGQVGNCGTRRAPAVGGITCAGEVALVRRRACLLADECAHAALAGVQIAGVAVYARCAVGSGHVGATARRGIADAGFVALVWGRRARDVARGGARRVDARVRVARIGPAARRSVRHRGVQTLGRAADGVAGSLLASLGGA